MSTRIKQRSFRASDSNTRGTVSVALSLFLFLICFCELSQTRAQEKPKPSQTASPSTQNARSATGTTDEFFITGTVRNAQTSKPVPDAEIQLLIASEPDPEKRILKGMTDKGGQYRIKVPLGNVQLWFPILKPGYWLLPADAMPSLVTTSDKPIVNHDIPAQTGAIWNVHWKGELTAQQRQLLSRGNPDQPVRIIATVQEVEDDAKRAAWLKGEPVSFDKANPTAMTLLEESGRGQLTEVGTSGKFILNLMGMMGELIVAPGFDHSHVASIKELPDSNTTRMIDRAGNIASITQAKVTLKNGVPLLTFIQQRPNLIGQQKLTGRVVDIKGKPVPGVRVGLVVGTKGAGSGDTGLATETTRDGKFSLNYPIYDRENQHIDQLQFSVVLNKAGYAGMDSPEAQPSPDFTPIDFKTLTLQPGLSLPVRILNEQNQPLPGAMIEPGDSYALRREVCRTDANGRAKLENLPSGVSSVLIRWGTKSKSIKLVISTNPVENQEETIHLKESLPTTVSRAEKPKPLAVGEVAPEWNIAAWSDGQTRKLSAYRGQIVVLDFWGIWCGGCVLSIPAQKQLAEKYAEEDVVFLNLHTADGEMSQINKLKQIEGWNSPTAIDRGSSAIDGVTCQSYGIQGYPTLVIIDQQGKIAFRGDIRPAQNLNEYMKELAKASGVNWPPPKDASQKQMQDTMNRIQITLFSREIDRLLKK